MWGFDVDFANYDFMLKRNKQKKKTGFQKKTLKFTPLARYVV